MRNNRKLGGINETSIEAKIENYLKGNDEVKSKVYYTDPEELSSYEREMQSIDLRSISVGLKMYKLSSLALDTIMYLHSHGGTIKGGYSDLTRALGRTDGNKGQVSNIRKMCITLEQQGILLVWHRDEHKSSIQIDLNPNWVNML